MKKLVVLGMGVCLVLAFASCKSSESAYKKAYEKAKQQELAEPQVEAPVEVTPVVAAPVTTTKVADTSGVRQEKVTVVSGNEGLKDYSVVAGSFGVKANAEGLKDWLDGQGYHSTIAFNADKAMYRVIVNSFADKAQRPTHITVAIVSALIRNKQAKRWKPITTTTTYLLVKSAQIFRTASMDDRSDIGFVNTNTKGRGSNHNIKVVIFPAG